MQNVLKRKNMYFFLSLQICSFGLFWIFYYAYGNYEKNSNVRKKTFFAVRWGEAQNVTDRSELPGFDAFPIVVSIDH